MAQELIAASPALLQQADQVESFIFKTLSAAEPQQQSREPHKALFLPALIISEAMMVPVGDLKEV